MTTTREHNSDPDLFLWSLLQLLRTIHWAIISDLMVEPLIHDQEEDKTTLDTGPGRVPLCPLPRLLAHVICLSHENY